MDSGERSNTCPSAARQIIESKSVDFHVQPEALILRYKTVESYGLQKRRLTKEKNYIGAWGSIAGVVALLVIFFILVVVALFFFVGKIFNAGAAV